MRTTAVAWAMLALAVLVLCPLRSDAAVHNATVRLQLKWKHQFQFAGYYMAQQQGYFAAEGLQVDIIEGHPGVSPSDEILNGHADFAIDSPGVLILRQNGAPLVALAAIFQHSPTILLARADADIHNPHDLLDKRIMLTPKTDPECLAMLVNAGLPLDADNLIPHSWNLDELSAGTTDAMSAYLTNEPFLLKQRGLTAQILNPIDFGIDFYGDCLVTSEDMARNRPELVEGFWRAVQRGWRYAMDNPTRTAVYIKNTYASGKSLAHLEFEAQAMRRLILPDLVEIGHMNPARWQHIADTYVRLGMLKPDPPLDGFLYEEIRAASSRKSRQLIETILAALGIMVAVGFSFGAMLLFFNARLTRQVRERTADLSASEHKFRTIFEMACVGAAQINMHDGRFQSVNAHMCSLFGYSQEELQQLTVMDLTDEEDLDLSVAAMEKLRVTRQEYTLEKRYRRKDGTLFWCIVTVSPLWKAHEEVNSALVLIMDITHQKLAESELVLAGKVFEHSVEGIVITNGDGLIEQVNPAFTTITGYTAAEAIGQNPRLLKSDRHSSDFYSTMWRHLEQEGHWAGEIWNRRKNGEAYPEWLTISKVINEKGETVHYISIFHDITELKTQQEQLLHQAQHDALTGLPNRILFHDRLHVALARMQRRASRLAILFLDLDNFKTVNDGLGHKIGDALLVDLAARFSHQLRDEDTLARLGGDEFLILLPDIDTSDVPGLIAERLLESLRHPFVHDDVEVFVTASIGITVAPHDGHEADKLIKNADMAMYRAKSLGRNNYQFFTQEMDIQAHRRISMESRLRRAVEQGEFELHYQPLVNIQSGQVLGAEALVRWRHNGSLVSPAEFIPLAEESGLILPLGDWILNTATQQARTWQTQGHSLTISVNLSARQFAGADLALRLQSILHETALESGRMYFEITESLLMGDMLVAEKTLHALREAGGRFYLDDFGTGYSSLSYLKRLPIDGLKIDRSFVQDVTSDSDSKAIVTAIVSLADTLNLNVIAEGVETDRQRELLSGLGVTIFQGYLASRPVSADHFETLLTQGALIPPL